MRHVTKAVLLVSLMYPFHNAQAQHNESDFSGINNPGIFELDYFAGTWECKGTAWDLKTGAATPVVGTWEFKYDCKHGMMTDVFTTTNGKSPFTVWAWNAYDSASKTHVRHETDSAGTWASSTSGGWGDNVIVWRGTMDTVAYGPYDTLNWITNKAPTSFWVSFFARPGGNARWFDAFKADCRRGPPWGR